MTTWVGLKARERLDAITSCVFLIHNYFLCCVNVNLGTWILHYTAAFITVNLRRRREGKNLFIYSSLFFGAYTLSATMFTSDSLTVSFHHLVLGRWCLWFYWGVFSPLFTGNSCWLWLKRTKEWTMSVKFSAMQQALPIMLCTFVTLSRCFHFVIWYTGTNWCHFWHSKILNMLKKKK